MAVAPGHVGIVPCDIAKIRFGFCNIFRRSDIDVCPIAGIASDRLNAKSNETIFFMMTRVLMKMNQRQVFPPLAANLSIISHPTKQSI